MTWAPYKGACLLIPFNDVPHLFVVLTDPCVDGMFLAVMVTSIKAGRTHDPTCEFAGGEHGFIVKPSYILYRLADTISARHAASMVAKGYYSAKPDLSPAELKRVTDGLFDSDETKRRIMNYATAQGL